MADLKALTLRASPTLDDFQQYVRDLKDARGFKRVKKDDYILLTKEIGELAAAMRKTWDNPDNVSAEAQQEIALEMADVFIYLLDLANQYGISMEKAFREKEEINKKAHVGALPSLLKNRPCGACRLSDGERGTVSLRLKGDGSW